MAFEIENFALMSAGFSDVKNIWAYKSTTETLDEVSAADYFLEVRDKLTTGDVIHLTTTSNPTSDIGYIVLTSTVNLVIGLGIAAKSQTLLIESNFLNTNAPRYFSYPVTVGTDVGLRSVVAVLQEPSATDSIVTLSNAFGVKATINVLSTDVAGKVYQPTVAAGAISPGQTFFIESDGLGSPTAFLNFTIQLNVTY